LPGNHRTETVDLALADQARKAEQRSLRRAYRALTRLLRRRPVSGRRAVAALFAEHARIAAASVPDAATNGEIVVRGRAKISADIALARSQRRLDRQAVKTDRLKARRAALLMRAEFSDAARVRHPDGGHCLVAELRTDEAAQRRDMENDMVRGSRKHQRLPRWLGRLPRVVLAADFGLLVYFFAGITDVNWASPLSVSLAVAVLLAVMVTVPTYGLLTFCGHRLRSYKDHTGTVALSEADVLTRLAVAAAVVAIAVVATLMFARMRTEVDYALGPGSSGAATLIAAVIAVVSAAANLLVIGIDAVDGSVETARLEALSAAANDPITRSQRHRRRAAMIPHRIAVRRRSAQRAATRAVSLAGRYLAAADQVITTARAIHQGSGPHAEPISDPTVHEGVIGYRNPSTGPKPDLRPLQIALSHVEESLD
jgi:hypothetical protein